MISELPHNIFVQIGTDTGITGLFLFGMLIYRTWKTEREIRLMDRQRPDGKPFAPLARGLLVGMWGFVIAGQFVTVTYYPFFWINLAFMVSLRNVARQHQLLAQPAANPYPAPAGTGGPAAVPALSRGAE
jgi:O-antigen ligase